MTVLVLRRSSLKIVPARGQRFLMAKLFLRKIAGNGSRVVVGACGRRNRAVRPNRVGLIPWRLGVITRCC